MMVLRRVDELKPIDGRLDVVPLRLRQGCEPEIVAVDQTMG